MGHTHPSIDAVETAVQAIVSVIESEMDDPIYHNSARDILDGSTRPDVDTQAASPESAFIGMSQYTLRGTDGGQMWVGLIEDARAALETAYTTLRKGLDPKDDTVPATYPSPFDPERIHKTSQLLCRLEAFVLAVQREMCGVTRTQQETLHNPDHDAEVKSAFDQGIGEVVRWLYTYNDVED